MVLSNEEKGEICLDNQKLFNSENGLDENENLEKKELETLDSFIEELNNKNLLKNEERLLNSNLNLNYSFDVTKLDSNIKKNAAFVKKLKNFTESMKDGILKDINTLNLSKYLTEIVAALVELKLKSNEVPIYLQICFDIHRKYPDFHGLLLEYWQKNLPKSSSELTNYTKLRIDLRLFAELILYGVFNLKDGLPILGNLLKLLLSEKQTINLNVILNFCKSCGWDYAGLIPKKMLLLASKYNKSLPISNFLNPDRQKALRNLLKEYYMQLCKHIETEHKNLQAIEFKNKEMLVTKGEISEKKKCAYEESKLSFSKTWSSMQQFAELLNEDLPILENINSELDDFSKVDKQSMLNIDLSNGIKINSIDIPLWEDENARSFYENLPNFKVEIPAHLYKESIKEKYQKFKKEKIMEKPEKIEKSDDKLETDKIDEKIEKKSQEKIEENDESLSQTLSKDLINDNSDEEGVNIDKELEKLQIESDEEDQNKKNKSTNGKILKESSKVHLDELLSVLLNCVTRDMIDKSAYNFCTNFNTKSSRKKLIRVLFTCPRTRLDLLPFYARFAAIVSPIMPLIGADLVYLLKKDFGFHLNKKDQINIESKIKTVRFIGELTKFGIFPKEETLQCLKYLLLDFTHHQIEMACNLLEVCGRYLYLNPSTHHKCNLLLQQMLRKKTLILMQPKYISMIENAYYNSCPTLSSFTQQQMQNDTQRQLEEKEELSQTELYCKYLIQKELDKKTIAKVLNILRKFDYSNKDFCSFIVKCFSEAWLIKYYSIKTLAKCLSGLNHYQPAIAYRVVDSIFEEIRIMFEINSIKHNQRRIIIVKYLGELYNHMVIDSSVLLRALYLLLSYGVNSNYEAFDVLYLEKNLKFPEQQVTEDESKQNKLNALNQSLIENAESELDPKDNLFRIRLICLLLDTSSAYISLSGKKKLECFIYFFQVYFLRKKEIYELFEDDKKFPPEIEFLFVDSIKRVKSKFKFSQTYHEAYLEIIRLFEILKPKILKQLPNNKKDKNSLDSIIELEDEEEEYDSEEELEEESLGEGDYDGLEFERTKNNLEDSDENETSNINDNTQLQVEKCKEQEEDEEDDEFQREFDKLLSESLTNRENENIRNINSDIVIPINKLENIINHKKLSLNQNTSNNDKEKTFNVILMTKAKNNKQVLKKVAVPFDSELAKSLQEKELAEKQEKERVKKLTLDINERREMEDELLDRNGGNLSLNLNRDSRKKYNHLKGVPDADLIFGHNKKK